MGFPQIVCRRWSNIKCWFCKQPAINSSGRVAYKVSVQVLKKIRTLTWFIAMTPNERKALEALRDPPTFSSNIAEDSEDFNIDDIWDGTDTLPISHTGGEFADLARGVLGEVCKS